MIINRKYCYLLLLLWSNWVQATTLDSLQLQLQLTTDAYQQLHLLHEIAEAQLRSEPEIALQSATAAWQIAHDYDLPLELAKAQENLGKIYLALNNYQHAEQYLLEVEKTYRNHGKTIALAQTQLSLAQVANLQKDFIAAGNYLNAALTPLRRAENPLKIAEWQLQMGIRYQGLEQFAKAAKLYQIVIPILQNAPAEYQTALRTAYENNFALQQVYNPVSELKQSNSNTWLMLFVSGVLLLFLAYLLYRRQAKLNQRHEANLQAKITRQANKLKATNEALAVAHAELQRFAYISSHDLKEPLRNIASFTTLIKRKLAVYLDQDTEEYFQFVSRSTRQIADLVTNISEYSNLDEKEVFFTYVNVNEVMESATKSLQKLITSKQAKVEYGELPVIYSNAGYLQLIFKNLIENGLKYNRSDCPQIKISCQETSDAFQFNVSDNGIGIAKEYHAYVFEMFRRLNSRASEGSGLGLAVCRKILRQLNGEINLTSTVDRGTTFHISLPKHLNKTVTNQGVTESVAAVEHLETRLNWLPAVFS